LHAFLRQKSKFDTYKLELWQKGSGGVFSQPQIAAKVEAESTTAFVAEATKGCAAKSRGLADVMVADFRTASAILPHFFIAIK
jgi:hypothetical protein